MAVTLIFVSFISTVVLLLLKKKTEEGQMRTAILQSLVIHGCLMAVSSELLSIVRALDFIHIFIFWLLIILTNLAILWLHLRRSCELNKLNSLLAKFTSLGFSSRLCIIVVTTIITISLIICLIAPPNNIDSMTYHMARVMHWIQNHSIAHYPTHIVRQIFMPPGATYIIAHLQILSGGDCFANFVQWVAFVGSILGVSLITRILIGTYAQWLSMLIAATIPMAIAQSTTTQTDLVTSFWLVCFTYFIFKFEVSKRASLFWITASFSLAIATKPTAVIFGIPLFLVFGFLVFRNSFLKSSDYKGSVFYSFKLCTILGLGSLILPMPSWARNAKAVGQFLGTDQTTRGEVHTLLELLSIFLKNFALNLPIPGFTQIVGVIHEYLLKVDPDEARLSFGDPLPIPFDTPMMSPVTLLIPSEDNISNPIHFVIGILALSSVLSLPFQKDSKKRIEIVLLGIATLGGFLFFCYLLKWQPWGNRLMLPLFFLQSPIIAYYLISYRNRKKSQWSNMLLTLISVVGIFYALTPIRHPLIALPTMQWSPEYLGAHQSQSILSLPRQAVYYSGSGKRLETAHRNAVNTIVDQYKCRDIGFFAGKDDWEYPIWMLLSEKTSGNFRFKHIDVQNESRNLEPEFLDSEMCAVMTSSGQTLKIQKK